MSSHADPMARLAAADPARELAPGDALRAECWRRVLAGELRMAAAGSPRRRRPRARPLVLLMPLALLLAAGALAAGGVIPLGTPAKLPYRELSGPRAGFGALVPGTVRLLPIAAPDPAGGPDWGMRVLSTTRGEGCIQIGRLLDGRLGALGRDHAFGDDGRFHELPARAGADVNGCADLDGAGRLFTNVTADARPASAWAGVGGRSEGCVPPTAGPYEKGLRLTPEEIRRGARPAALCPQSDLRNIYYGLLGPDAKSITYVLGGQRHTLPTVGSEGAYMFVTRASPNQLLNFADAGTADVVPVDGPIREIHYAGGATCHLTSKSWIGGAYACTPSLPVPMGYVPVGRVATRGEVATPLHVHLLRGHDRRWVILISFRAPIAVTDSRRAYVVRWVEPHSAPGVYAGTGTDSDLPAGHTISWHIGEFGPRLRAGVTHGTVSLLEQTGAGGLEGPGSATVEVGSFAVRVP